MELKSINFCILAASLALAGCDPEVASRSLGGGKKVEKKDEGEIKIKNSGTKDVASADSTQSIWDKKVAEKKEDNRSDEEIICQDGLTSANLAGYDDFSNIFSVICTNGGISDSFKEAVAQSYDGVREPTVQVVEKATNGLFVTKLLFLYAIRAPLASPAQFADMKIFDRLDGKGIESPASRLSTSVEARNPFPGKGSVEEIVLNHHLQLAEGASLFDRRRTSINNYLFSETTRDLTLTTEHLLDDDNEHYHVARGIMVGLKDAEPGFTNLVYVNELIIKNRIDPERLTSTLLNLSISNQRIIYEETKIVSEQQ